MSEKQIEGAILSYLNYQSDVFAFKVNTMGVWDQARKIYRTASKFIALGTPDILLCVKPGIFAAMEVKIEGGKQSENQKLFEVNLKSVGGHYYVVKSLKDAEAALSLIRASRVRAVGSVH